MIIEIPDGRDHEQPLLFQYSGQCRPQDAHLRIDPEDNRAYWDWNAEINAIPMTVFHGREFWISVPCDLTVEDIRELSSSVEPLVERVVAGYSCEWDGSNMRGALTDDGREALEALETVIYRG